MRIYVLLFLAVILIASSEGCRKPGQIFRSPCNDSTLLQLHERRTTLTASERLTYDSLCEKCEKYVAVEENRGKLWPGILAGLAIVAAVGALLLWLLVGKNTDPVD